MRTVRSWIALALGVFLTAACGSDNPSNPGGQAATSSTGGGAGNTSQGSGGGGASGASTTMGGGGTSSSGGASGGGSAGQDTGGGGSTNPEGGTGACPSVAGTAGHSSEGVLTNYPAFHFTKTGGDFEISSIYMKLQKLTTFNSIQVWGDIKNTSTKQLCIPLADTFTIGFQDVLVIVNAQAYKGSGTVSDTCLEPGGKGFFRGIQNDVDATLLDTPSTVAYSISGFSTGVLEIPHPSDPILESAAPKHSSLGWVVDGKMKAPATIWNLKIGLYIRDPNGLLYADTDAFPNDLGTINALSEFDFETFPTDNEICNYERFENFIDGPKTLAFGEGRVPALQGRSLDYASRLDSFDAAKRILRSGR